MLHIEKKQKIDNFGNEMNKLKDVISYTNIDCPWTKNLKLKDVLHFLDGELDEAFNAISNNDYKNLEEEIGDIFWNILLVQFVCSNLKIPFSLERSINNVINKMKKRYTWVNFPDQQSKQIAVTVEDVERIWNKNHDDKHGKFERLIRDKEFLEKKIEKLINKVKITNEKKNKAEIRLYQIKEVICSLKSNVNNTFNMLINNTNKNIKSVCVFCSSSKNTNKKFLDQSERLGNILAFKKITCITGGGTEGCMGALNKSVNGNNGRTISITHEMWTKNKNYSKNKIFTDEIVATGNDLSERKKYMKFMANSYIVLPGGPGTWDEMWDIISEKSLGLIKNDIVIVNMNGYYNGTKMQIETAFNNGIISSHEIVKFVDNVDKAINFLF
jgi:uncharacterized protein (TIGR00730 family)